jgi:hypothetical protein
MQFVISVVSGAGYCQIEHSLSSQLSALSVNAYISVFDPLFETPLGHQKQ